MNRKTLAVFPNPVLDALNVELAGGEARIQVVDMQGKIWLNKTAVGSEAVLDVLDLPAGCMFA